MWLDLDFTQIPVDGSHKFQNKFDNQDTNKNMVVPSRHNNAASLLHTHGEHQTL